MFDFAILFPSIVGLKRLLMQPYEHSARLDAYRHIRYNAAERMCKLNATALALICLASNTAVFGQSLKEYLQSYVRVNATPNQSIAKQLTEKKKEITISPRLKWRAAARGVERISQSTDPWEQRRLFHSRRWLPCDEVLALAQDSTNKYETVWIETGCGLSEIQFKPIRLSKKAAYFEERVVARHSRHHLVADSTLTRPGDLSSNLPRSNDNDGLWTAMYAAAKLFEYGATKSPAALKRAEESTAAVLNLEVITNMPGYPARSWVTPQEEKPRDGVWFEAPDKSYIWKSDTSSDEIVGHFLLFDLAWDLLPKGELRNKAAATCRRMMDHILSNGYYLIDRSGKPTTWGQWSPAYFASKKGYPDSPLNSLELLSFLKVTARITGDAKYLREFDKAAYELGYLDIMTQYKERQEEINYSDEELALLSFFPWMRHEKDPKLRAKLEQAFEGWWKNIQREKNPLWNSIREIGYRKPDPARRRDSIATLQRIPMDTIAWRIENSWRTELPLESKQDRFNKAQTTVLLAPDERAVMKWNGNPFVLDGGNGGRSEDDGAFFLLPYWMGRYFKLWDER